jgi:hypothetical protein
MGKGALFPPVFTKPKATKKLLKEGHEKAEYEKKNP